MKAQVSVDIAAPSELVFDLMADVRNEVHWNGQVSRAELRSEEPIGQGSRFLSVNRGYEYDAVITDYTRPERLEFEVTGKPMAITPMMRFSSSGAGTRLEADFDMRPNGFMKVMLALMAPMVRRDFPKQFASFKEFCESRVSS